MEHVTHPFQPVYDANSHTLILGSMASPMSRKNGFYYGHPQNRFFPALARVFDEETPRTNGERRAFVLRHGLALWDVVQSCDIVGASDASIQNAVPNDIPSLLRQTRITRVFATGQTAARLYRTLLETRAGLPCATLPSPSPANCRMPMEQLVSAYRALLLE